LRSPPRKVFITPIKLKGLVPSGSLWIDADRSLKEIESLLKRSDVVYAQAPQLNNQKNYQDLPKPLADYFKGVASRFCLSDRGGFTDKTHYFPDFNSRNEFIKNNLSKNRFYLDISRVGTGKTYASANLTVEYLGVDRIYFFKKLKFERNVPGLDKFTPYPARHKGLIKDLSMVNHDGQPVWRNVKRGEEPEIPKNCAYPGVSLSCFKCSYRDACQLGSGDYYAIAEKREAINRPYIVAHPNSLVSFKLKGTEALIFDEAEDILELIKSYELSLSVLPNYLYAIYAAKDELTKLGIAQSVWEEADLFSLRSAFIDRGLNDDRTWEISDLLTNWSDKGVVAAVSTYLIPLLNALCCSSAKVVKTCESATTIIYLNRPLILQLKQAKLVLFLDGTMDASLLKPFGIDLVTCIVGNPALCPHENVKIRVLEGKNPTRRAEAFVMETAESLKSYVLAVDPSAGIISPKVLEGRGDIVIGRNSRGSNEFENKKTLLILALPRINLAAAQAQFDVLNYPLTFENAPHKFHDFYRGIEQSNLIQCLGRLRYARRKDEELVCYLLGDKGSIVFLRSIGFKVYNFTIPLQFDERS
jgi:hypothetical protein